jgi:hypothetical protein
MADTTPPQSPNDDPLSPRIDDHDVKSALNETKTSAFQQDAFLSGSTPSSSASEKPQIVRRGGIGFFTAFVMSCLATAGGASLALVAQSRPDLMARVGLGALVPAPAPAPSAGTSDLNIAPLARRIDAIEAELVVLKAQLEGKPVGAPPTPATSPGRGDPAAPPQAIVQTPAQTPPQPSDVGTMKSELAGIGGRVTAIETRLAALDPTGSGGAVIAGLQADIATLKSIVASLQQQVASAPSPAVTFAMVNLAEAANRSTPFLTEFETLRAAMPNVAEVAALEAYARTGVPTRTLLQERFSVLEPALVAATKAAANEGGFFAWFRGLFADMVKVKPATNIEGTSNEAILARAKIKLDQGDLPASVEEVSRIANPPTQVGEWLTSARQRLDLESRIAAVRGAIGRAPVGVAASPLAPVQPQTLPQSPALPTPAQPVPAPPASDTKSKT